MCEYLNIPTRQYPNIVTSKYSQSTAHFAFIISLRVFYASINYTLLNSQRMKYWLQGIAGSKHLIRKMLPVGVRLNEQTFHVTFPIDKRTRRSSTSHDRSFRLIHFGVCLVSRGVARMFKGVGSIYYISFFKIHFPRNYYRIVFTKKSIIC